MFIYYIWKALSQATGALWHPAEHRGKGKSLDRETVITHYSWVRRNTVLNSLISAILNYNLGQLNYFSRLKNTYGKNTNKLHLSTYFLPAVSEENITLAIVPTVLSSQIDRWDLCLFVFGSEQIPREKAELCFLFWSRFSRMSYKVAGC